MSKLIYVAAPYSDPDQKVVAERMMQFEIVYASLLQQGLFPVSPLVNHRMAGAHVIPADWGYWQAYSEALLERCDEIHVITLPGWEKSSGVTGEIKFAAEKGITVVMVDPKPLAEAAGHETLHYAVQEGDYVLSNEHAICDYKLPDIVRGFLAMNMGRAVETNAIEEAGFMPPLYAEHEGIRCRVVMVSRMGDVGISYENKRYGYAKRVSIYDLTNFRLTWNPTDELPKDRMLDPLEWRTALEGQRLGKRARRRARGKAG